MKRAVVPMRMTWGRQRLGSARMFIYCERHARLILLDFPWTRKYPAFVNRRDFVVERGTAAVV